MLSQFQTLAFFQSAFEHAKGVGGLIYFDSGENNFFVETGTPPVSVRVNRDGTLIASEDDWQKTLKYLGKWLFVEYSNAIKNMYADPCVVRSMLSPVLDAQRFNTGSAVKNGWLSALDPADTLYWTQFDAPGRWSPVELMEMYVRGHRARVALSSPFKQLWISAHPGNMRELATHIMTERICSPKSWNLWWNAVGFTNWNDSVFPSIAIQMDELLAYCMQGWYVYASHCDHGINELVEQSLFADAQMRQERHNYHAYSSESLSGSPVLWKNQELQAWFLCSAKNDIFTDNLPPPVKNSAVAVFIKQACAIDPEIELAGIYRIWQRSHDKMPTLTADFESPSF